MAGRTPIPPERLSLHVADALEFDFATLGDNLRIVGNLPYNISSPLLFHLARHEARLTDLHDHTGFAALFTEDAELLKRCTINGKVPKVGVLISIDEVFMHCAKAFRRSELWNPATWPDRADLPSYGCMIRDQAAGFADVPAETIDEHLEADYAATLWEVGGKA